MFLRKEIKKPIIKENKNVIEENKNVVEENKNVVEEIKQKLPNILRGLIGSYNRELVEEMCRQKGCTFKSFSGQESKFTHPLLGDVNCSDYCVNTCENWLYSLLNLHPKNVVWKGNHYSINSIGFKIPVKNESEGGSR